METKRRDRSRVGLALFVLGSLAFAVGAWLPWAIFLGGGYTAFDAGSAQYFDPGDATTLPLLVTTDRPHMVAAIWSVVAVLGLALGPLLTARVPWWLPRLAHALAGLWLLGTSALAVAITVVILRGSYHPPLPTCANCPRIPYALSGLSVGIVVVFAGLVLAWVGWALALANLWRGVLPTNSLSSPLTKGAGRRIEVGLLGVGAVLWAVGFYLIPWATSGCNRPIGLIGFCSGYPASISAQIGLYAQTVLDPTIMVYAVPLLLGLGALYLVVTLSQRRFEGRVARNWLGAWLLLAIAVEWLAITGVEALITASVATNPHDSSPHKNGTLLPLATGPGMIVAAVGLVLVVLGLFFATGSSVWHAGATIEVPDEPADD